MTGWPVVGGQERAGRMTGAGRLKDSGQRMSILAIRASGLTSQSAIKGGLKKITCIPLQLRMTSSARADSQLVGQHLARITATRAVVVVQG
jgi:hypothetical protein